MSVENITVIMICFSTVLLLAIYWIIFKIRQECNESREKIISELSEIRKSLEKKAEDK